MDDTSASDVRSAGAGVDDGEDVGPAQSVKATTDCRHDDLSDAEGASGSEGQGERGAKIGESREIEVSGRLGHEMADDNRSVCPLQEDRGVLLRRTEGSPELGGDEGGKSCCHGEAG